MRTLNYFQTIKTLSIFFLQEQKQKQNIYKLSTYLNMNKKYIIYKQTLIKIKYEINNSLQKLLEKNEIK